MKFIYDGKSTLSGVYKITNTTNGKIYIGSAKEFRKRAYRHRSSLEKGVHQNKHLQRAFVKCGTAAFVFEVLEVVLGDKLARTTVEQTYLDQFLDDWERCYNFKKKTVASPRSCYSKTPEETSKKLSEVSKRRWADQDMREKHGQRMVELWADPEYREETVQSMKANDERRAKMSETTKRLWEDPTFRAKMEAAQRARRDREKVLKG